jgi:hypothetical protein
MPSPAPSPWTFAGHVAARHDAESDVALDLCRPERGLVVQSAAGRRDHLLGIDVAAVPAAVPTDHWIRGDDVTAVYEPTDARRLRATAMWRVHRDGVADATGWELVVSAQTSLLESDAALAVVSELEAAELLWSGGADDGGWHPIGEDAVVPADATCVLARRTAVSGPSTSVLIAVHPADRRRIVVASAGPRTRVECWLFAAVLEKGVLLRSRVLAAVGPAATDVDWADRMVADFVASPPPLTT